MGTSVQVTPLCGVYNEKPLSYLVSIDAFNILIDCGWNDHFHPSLLQPLSRHLNGTVLESFLRPAVLITDAYNVLSNQPSRRQRDQEFLHAILNTLRANGNVLLPVDTAGRVLELLLILEQYWEQHHLTYPIFFLTYVSSSTIDYVKSFLEWMSDPIAKSFEHTRDNAFLLK